MLSGERKPLDEIKKSVEGKKRILVLGCETCTAISGVGGLKEARNLASTLKLSAEKEGLNLKVEADVIKRQCDQEFVEEILDELDKYDAVISLACGAGVQLIADNRPGKATPGLDTIETGVTAEEGWMRYCIGCGDCILEETVGICPKARCAKGLLNGPCGGVCDGICEVEGWGPCVWVLIFDRMMELNKLDEFMKTRMPKMTR